MRNSFFILAAFIVVLASTRGALVYHFGTPPDLTYTISAFSLVLLGLYATFRMRNTRVSPELVPVKKAFQLNIALIGAYWMFFLVIGGVKSLAIAYTFLLFPISFALMRVSKKELELILHAIFAVTAAGVFIMQAISLNDFQELYRVQNLLRPSQYGISHIGGIAQIGGYQANNHDAANILVMICTYYFIKMYMSNGLTRLLFVAALAIGILALFLTGSASNISVFLGILLLVILFIQKSIFKKLVSISLIGLLGWMVFTVDYQYFDVLHFTAKFRPQSTLEGGGMFNSINPNAIVYSLPSIFLGFGYQLDVPMIHSEIAFIKILVGYGLIPTIVLLYIFFLPLSLIRRANNYIRKLRFLAHHGYFKMPIKIIKLGYQNLILLSAPILAGALTLLHYGSLLRVSSIGIFCVLLTIFLKDYVIFIDEIKRYSSDVIDSEKSAP